jgi:hypothetical protein
LTVATGGVLDVMVRNLAVDDVIVGTTTTVALPDFVISAVLVALIVTGFGSGILAGAL